MYRFLVCALPRENCEVRIISGEQDSFIEGEQRLKVVRIVICCRPSGRPFTCLLGRVFTGHQQTTLRVSDFTLSEICSVSFRFSGNGNYYISRFLNGMGFVSARILFSVSEKSVFFFKGSLNL